MTNVIRVGLYARVSSQKQADEKTIDSQCEAIRRRVQNEGLVLSADNFFCDEGYSGAELLRPGLEKLRDRVAASLIDRIYIHSPDRLARKMAHQALLLEEFHKHDCEVVFLNQEGLPDSPEANLLIQMQGMIAEYEREKILERTRRGRRHAASVGHVSVFGGAPYGYRYIRKSIGDGGARWEIDPIESGHVQLMFQLVGEQQFSLGGLARELRRRAIQTRAGKVQWDPSTLRGILINPAYYGKARYGKNRLAPRKPGKRANRGNPQVPRKAKVPRATDRSEQIEITVPAIIDQALFHRVAEQMEENRKRQRQRQRQDGPKYLLSGLLICGQCGSAYCSRRPGVGNHRYYRCLGTDKFRHEGQAICTNSSVKAEEFEQVVWSEVCNLLLDPSRLQAELDRRRTEQTFSPSYMQQREREIADLRTRLDRLIDGYTSGLIEKDEFESRIGPLRARHAREESALLSLRGQLEQAFDFESAERALHELADSVKDQLAVAEYSLKRRLIELLIKRIEILPEEIRIVYKVPKDPFAQGPDNRGFLQHRLWLHRSTRGEGASATAAPGHRGSLIPQTLQGFRSALRDPVGVGGYYRAHSPGLRPGLACGRPCGAAKNGE